MRQLTETLSGNDFLEVMPIALAAVSVPDGRFLFTNEIFRNLFQIPSDHDDQLTVFDFYPSDDVDQVRAWYGEIGRRPPGLVEIGRRYVKTDGQIFHGFTYGRSMAGQHGHVDRIVGAFFDTKTGIRSSFVEKASQKRSSRERASLARELADDLNNAIAELSLALEVHSQQSNALNAVLESVLNRTVKVARKLLSVSWGTRSDAMVPTVSSLGKSSEADEGFNQSTRPMRILVVEDSVVLRDQLVHLLNEYGNFAIGVATEPEALDAAEEWNLNCAVIDLRLEHEFGRDVGERLRQDRPGLSIVYVTGYTTLSAVEASRSSDPVLLKPFRVWEVIEALRYAGADGS